MKKIFKIKLTRGKRSNRYLADAIELESVFSEGLSKASAISKIRKSITSIVALHVKSNRKIRLFESDMRGTEIPVEIDENANFVDPKVFSLTKGRSAENYKLQQETTERQNLQRREGNLDKLPSHIDSEKVRSALARGGFKITKTGGNHPYTAEGPNTEVFPVDSGKIYDDTLRKIIKEAHLTIPEFLALLNKDVIEYDALRNIKSIKRD